MNIEDKMKLILYTKLIKIHMLNEKEFVDDIWSNTERKNDPYVDLLNIRKISYELYKENRLKLLQKDLENLGVINNQIKCVKAVNLVDSYKQSSKSRGGKNLELFISKILDQYCISYHTQYFGNVCGDFIFENKSKIIVLSVKSTLKERWKEFFDDIQPNVSEVYVLTLEMMKESVIEKLHSKDIKIVNVDLSFKDFLLFLKKKAWT